MELKTLLETPTPSGFEKLGQELIFEELKDITSPVIDSIGNIHARIGNGPKTILLSGHIDEICMIVQKINDNGTVSLLHLNGVDKKVLPGSIINLVLEDGKVIPGIVGKLPIHMEKPDSRPSTSSVRFTKLDIGTKSKEETLELGVTVGMPAVYSSQKLLNLNNTTRIVSSGLDDKVGVYIALTTFTNLFSRIDESWSSKYSVVFASCVQEEVGLRGATVLAQNIKADISIDFDVTFATDCEGISTDEYGVVNLGSGPVICYGPGKSNRLNKLLIDQAEKLDCKYQLSSVSPTGTNTNTLQLFGGNTETSLVSIPLRNMHTQVEMADWNDINSTVKLITNLITSCKL